MKQDIQRALAIFESSVYSEPYDAMGIALASVRANDRSELIWHLLLDCSSRFGSALCPSQFIREFPDFEEQIRLFFEAQGEKASIPEPLESLDTLPDKSHLEDAMLMTAQLIAGRYRVEVLLGEGTHGAVFRAFDEILRRPVAVKLSKSSESNLAVQEFNSFLEESRILSALEHPRILPVLDAGVTKDGRQFFVSKYLSGGNLEDRVAAGKTGSIPMILGIVREISEALQHAHQHGLYHRDVKLANIVFDDAGNPFLADFGLALKEAERRERAGSLAGSPVFMAPEQVRASAVSIDGRTDIWALGVVLYYLLTGHYPFPGGKIDAVFREILERQPQPPRQLNPSVSRRLEHLTLKCLEKEVTDRFRSAAELSEELKSLLDDEYIHTALHHAGSELAEPAYAHRTSYKWLPQIALTCLAIVCTIILTAAWGSKLFHMKAIADREASSSPQGSPTKTDTLPRSEQESQVNHSMSPNEQEAPPGSPTSDDTATDGYAIAFDRDDEASQSSQFKEIAENTRHQVEASPLTAAVVKDSLSIPPVRGAFPDHPGAQTTTLPSVVPEVNIATEDSDWPVEIDEDFSHLAATQLPPDWSDPSGRLRVKSDGVDNFLVSSVDDLSVIRLPEIDLAGEFEIDFDIQLPGGYFDSPSFRVDLVAPGVPTISIGATINAGRIVCTLLGASSRQPAAVQTIDSEVVTLSLIQRNGTLHVKIQNELMHTVEFDFVHQHLQLGLANYTRVHSALVRTKSDETVGFERNMYTHLVEEDFSATPPGSVPQGWRHDNGSIYVEHSNGSPRLTSYAPSTVDIPLADILEGAFLIEADLSVPGGYAKESKFGILLKSLAHHSIEVGLRIEANAVVMNAKGARKYEDVRRVPWNQYITDRGRLRISREGGRIMIFVGDDLMQSFDAAQSFNEISLKLGEGAKLYWLRVDASH